MDKIIVSVVLVAVVGGGVWYFATATTLPTTNQLYYTDSVAQTPVAAESSTSNAQQLATTNQNKTPIMNATFHTTKGDITIEFDTVSTPNTVANFIKLAQSGFYDGTKFHRIIAGFMVQGGDPFSKDDSMQARWGTGGPGYQFADEIGPNNRNDVGTIAMANSGPNTNGSQFFINSANNNFLDPKHTVFGRVVAGADVVAAIGASKTDSSDRPVEPVVITSITLK